MVAQSMTGFGAAESKGQYYLVQVEIKSVNHRFRDFRFKMSSTLAGLEMELRKRLELDFKRGHFDVYINYKALPSQAGIFDQLDENKISTFTDDFQKLFQKKSMSLRIRPTDFLRSEFYKDEDESRKDEIINLSRSCLSEASTKLKECREEEGQKLIVILKDHLKIYAELLDSVRKHTSDFEQEVMAKLNKRWAQVKKETNIEMDQSRFYQELVYYLEKIDVSEELDRIESHLSKYKKLLNKKRELGREMEFLLQELFRETNTLGSKSSKTEISQTVVQMKVQLEKMREQILNLE